MSKSIELVGRHQTSVPVIETIVRDDAGQFKLLTDKLALCWPRLHKHGAGRHYEKLSPVRIRLLDLKWRCRIMKQRLDAAANCVTTQPARIFAGNPNAMIA